MAQKKFRKVYWTSNPGTMFSREKDINRRADEDVYVDYGEDEQFATEEDL